MNEWGSSSRYGLVDVALYLLGIAGLAASLTLVFLSMRAVMDVGGFCAEGGPYEIQTHCPEGTVVLLPLSIFAGLGSAALAGWKGSQIGGPFAGLVALAWPALFISLGWNFLEYALWPPGDQGGIVWGWLIPGIVFEIMGILPLLGLLPSRRAFLGTETADSPVALTSARKRLLNDLVSHAHERGWGAQEDLVSKLERLAALREQGAITSAEFEAAKQAVIGGSTR
ncbi:MAG TPA: SHOCT domain-containing protein [Candidatus Limnocylindrales bacterium]